MLKHNEPMSRHCSLRAGGLAQDFFLPDTLKQLQKFLQSNQKPVLILGLGSNLLVRERGFSGVVIKLKQLNQLSQNALVVTAGAGVTLAKLSRFCDANSLNGGEFLSAIPGSVGGALMMNGGAFGAEIWQFVQSVKTINRSGAVFERQPADFEIGYRQVLAKHTEEYFIQAKFKFSAEQKLHNIKSLLAKRRKSQPTAAANCGSVFKNPTNPKPYFAAKLIQKSQLKGVCVGGACVSEKHANFIINQNNATASDIEKLIKLIQKKVKSDSGISLETEVVIV
ncbi:MAG: UDP-N-acetylmuramate dehydrogenase [Candidatus Thioglobus sp.]|nr:UDP-N-acetylmuramate dehydrogenase [Candidatus Thioglobus sp.]